MRTFEYRLYPNRAQRQHLMACLVESRAIYNEMLAALKAQYEVDGTFPTKYDLTALFKGRGGRVCPLRRYRLWQTDSARHSNGISR
jgi:helix-turn-helix protein